MSFTLLFYQRWYKGDAGKGEDRVSDSVLSCLAFSFAVVCKTWISDLERLILFLARRVGRAKVIH